MLIIGWVSQARNKYQLWRWTPSSTLGSRQPDLMEMALTWVEHLQLVLRVFSDLTVCYVATVEPFVVVTVSCRTSFLQFPTNILQSENRKEAKSLNTNISSPTSLVAEPKQFAWYSQCT